MPFYNIFVDWTSALGETEQFNRLQWAVERTLNTIRRGEHLIVGVTSLSTRRSRATFQSSCSVEAADFSSFKVDGAARIVFSPIVLADSGFPLLEMSEEAVELN
jgi:hypothetical protein